MKSNASRQKSIINNKEIKATLKDFYEEIKCDDQNRKLFDKKFNEMKLVEIQNVSSY